VATLIRAAGAGVSIRRGRQPIGREGTDEIPTTETVSGRLADARRRIEMLSSRMQDAREDTRGRVDQRVSILQRLEASVRSTLEAATEAGLGGSFDDLLGLDRAVDQIDAEIGIAVSQLDLDGADDRAAFEGAVASGIARYQAFAAAVRIRAGPAAEGSRGRLEASVESIDRRRVAATARLERLREAPDEAWDALKGGILSALDDLDHAVRDVRSLLG
jgi:hypothetical protein